MACHPLAPEAILICDRDVSFREALRNMLLSASYPKVEVVAGVREGLAKLRIERYRCLVIGLARRHSVEQRWAMVARSRQPGARLLFAIAADQAVPGGDGPFDYIMKERAFSALLLLAENGERVGADEEKRK